LLSSLYFTCTELSLAYRQFGHASVDGLLRVFPPPTFSSTDVATLHDVSRS